MTFTERLEELMQKRHIANKSELSRISGIPYTTIDGFYKRSSDNIKLSTLKKLSECLNCSIDYLVGNDIGYNETSLKSELGTNDNTRFIWEKVQDGNIQKLPAPILKDRVKESPSINDKVKESFKINDKVKESFDELGVNTIAAHFDGEGYTPDELEKIKEFAAFLKTQSKIK